MNGSNVPCLAWRRSERTMVTKLIAGPTSRGGVASHGASQPALRARTSSQAARSARAIGRSPTRPATSVAGQPRVIAGPLACSVVAPVHLLDRVHEQRTEHLHAVPYPTRRARQVYDERRARP